MADYSLKDEKRINTNGEWDKVTTHPNNEPIFRQNGHELVFDSSNQDSLELANSITMADNSVFEFDITLFNLNQNQPIASDGTNASYITIFAPTGQFYIESDGQGQLTNQSLIIGKNTVKIRRGVNQSFLSVNGATEQLLSFTNPFRFKNWSNRANVYSSFILHEFSINNETFNPIDIDSSGQIEGSSGTVATVNTSHASGLSYILGTVFQKSSFALAFDSGNSEYLKIQQNSGIITNLSDIDVSFMLDTTTPSVNENILSIGTGSAEKLFISLRNGVLNLWIRDNNASDQYFTISGGVSELTIKNLEIKQDGVLIGTLTDKVLNIDTSTDYFQIGQRVAFTPFNLDRAIYNFSLQGVNYPLTEGLGNTTDGATINTSHADGIKRINFGMWLQGNDTDGWTPYTIV